MRPLTRHEKAVLKMIIKEEGEIDAADFADEIVALMSFGLVELSGTLRETTIVATLKGKALLLSGR